MPTMTLHALHVVRKFTANPRLDALSGVRIARSTSNMSSTTLKVSAVPGPQPSDAVVQQSGGRLYLGPEAAQRLQDKIIDVRTDDLGRVEFFVKAA